MGIDVAVFQDGSDDLQYTSYLLLTDAATQGVRVVGEEYLEQWCIVSEGDGCRGTYRDEVEAYFELQEPLDEAVPAIQCPFYHEVEWDERNSPPPPPNHP